MRLLITGAWQNARDFFPELEKRHEILFLQQERDPLPCDPSWVEGVVCNGLFLYHPIESFPNLRTIQLTSAGCDRVPMDYVREKGIEIHNARGVYSVPMAEFVLASVLERYKQLSVFRQQQRDRQWKKLRELRELAGKTVVIIGCGDVGTECAKRFRAFGTYVVGVNRTVREAEGFDTVVGLEKLDEALRSADIAVVTIALSEGTRGLVKARLLKPEALLANVSRGATVDLTGAGCELLLDVFEAEPLDAGSDLWDSATVTPHNSFVGDGNAARLSALILANLGL
jgi:phosphoglycerate dehydrogenase-like enzyme